MSAKQVTTVQRDHPVKQKFFVQLDSNVLMEAQFTWNVNQFLTLNLDNPYVRNARKVSHVSIPTLTQTVKENQSKNHVLMECIALVFKLSQIHQEDKTSVLSENTVQLKARKIQAIVNLVQKAHTVMYLAKMLTIYLIAEKEAIVRRVVTLKPIQVVHQEAPVIMELLIYVQLINFHLESALLNVLPATRDTSVLVVMMSKTVQLDSIAQALAHSTVQPVHTIIIQLLVLWKIALHVLLVSFAQKKEPQTQTMLLLATQDPIVLGEILIFHKKVVLLEHSALPDQASLQLVLLDMTVMEPTLVNAKQETFAKSDLKFFLVLKVISVTRASQNIQSVAKEVHPISVFLLWMKTNAQVVRMKCAMQLVLEGLLTTSILLVWVDISVIQELTDQISRNALKDQCVQVTAQQQKNALREHSKHRRVNWSATFVLTDSFARMTLLILLSIHVQKAATAAKRSRLSVQRALGLVSKRK